LGQKTASVRLEGLTRRPDKNALTNLTNLRPSARVVVMSRLLNLYAAKAQLSALVEEAAAGGEIIIAKAGRPRAKLVPLRQTTRRRPGRAKGKIWIAADFDAPLPAALGAAFAGDAPE
jgi:prevent-host-death family protein